MYRVYGDDRLAATHWSTLVRYLDWEIGRLQNGLAITALGDYLPPGYGGNPPEDTRLTATAYLHRALTATAELGDLLGHDDVAARYRQAAAGLRDALNATFLRDGAYRTDKDPDYRQTSNAIPLAFGLVPAESVASVVDSLVADVRARGNHLNTGALGTSVLLPVLTAHGHADVAHAIATQRTYPELGLLVRQRRGHHVGDVAGRLAVPRPLLPGHGRAVGVRERGGPASRRRGLPPVRRPS